LRALRKEYEELTKTREDQDEKLESLKGMSREVIERRRNAETEINKLAEEIEKMNKMIKESKEKALEKET